MAAQAGRSLEFLAHACSRERLLTALYGCIALVALTIGVLGLLDASWPKQILGQWINIHLLFGLLLCGLVLARYRWHISHSPPMRRADVRELSRHLSRIVYLLLYVVIGVREVIGILQGVLHGGAVDFKLFDGHFRHGPDYLGFNPNEDFQLFFASGLFALLFVRVLASGLFQRLTRIEWR